MDVERQAGALSGEIICTTPKNCYRRHTFFSCYGKKTECESCGSWDRDPQALLNVFGTKLGVVFLRDQLIGDPHKLIGVFTVQHLLRHRDRPFALPGGILEDG